MQDFKSYPFQFPFKDASCLTCNTPAILKQISKMHEDDAHDDDLIAVKTSTQVHTHAHLRAAKNADNSHVLAANVRNHTSALRFSREADEVKNLPTIVLLHATSGNDFAAARPSVERDEAGMDLYAELADYSELEITKALARHSAKTGLPKQYTPNHLVPEGKMHVVGVKTKKSSTKKAVLIVKFISPPSSKDVHI